MYLFTKKQNLRIEQAIKFTALKIKRADKPVVFHSLKIALYLASKNCSAEIIIAAILHDVIEDSNCKIQEIKNKFGQEIARIVQAVSFEPKINDSIKRYQEMFARTNKAGKKALIIKAADIYDNSHFYYLVEDNKHKEILMEKIGYFLNISKKKIGQTEIWRDLNKQYTKLKNSL